MGQDKRAEVGVGGPLIWTPRALGCRSVEELQEAVGAAVLARGARWEVSDSPPAEVSAIYALPHFSAPRGELARRTVAHISSLSDKPGTATRMREVAALVASSRAAVRFAEVRWRRGAMLVPVGAPPLAHVPARRRSSGPWTVAIIGNERRQGHIFTEAGERVSAPVKGSEDLPALAARLDPQGMRWVIAGTGWEVAARSLEGLGFKVELLGRISPVAVSELLRDVDVVLSPSLTETGPLSGLEALAHGVPVVARPIGELGEVLPAEWTWQTTAAGAEVLRALREERARLRGSRRSIARRLRGRDRASYGATVAGLLLDICNGRILEPAPPSELREERRRPLPAPRLSPSRLRGAAKMRPSPSVPPGTAARERREGRRLTFLEKLQAAAREEERRRATAEPVAVAEPVEVRWPHKLISVLISAYHAERWLAAAVCSALSQRLPDGWRLEVLIAVDGCAETLAAARELRDPRVRVFWLAANAGTYAAKNALLSYARGDAHAIRDADDVSIEDSFARLLEVLQARGGIVGGQMERADEELRPLGPFPLRHASPRERLDLGEQRCHMIHGTMLIEARAWELLGGYEPHPFGADQEMQYRAYAAGIELTNIPRPPVLLRRQHPQQLTRAEGTGHRSKARIDYADRIDREFRARRRGVFERAPVYRRRTPPMVASIFCSLPEPGTVRTVAIMATAAGHDAMATVAIELLAAQADLVIVFADGPREDAAGLPCPPGVLLIPAQERRGPAARYLDGPGLLEELAPRASMVLTVDDDIRYPADYARVMREALEVSEVATLHGQRWSGTEAPTHRTGEMLHYRDALAVGGFVARLGSGVSAWRPETFIKVRELARDILEAAPMDDDIAASLAVWRAGARIWRPATRPGWLADLDRPEGDRGLYGAAQADRFAARDALYARAFEKGWTGAPPAFDPRAYWLDRRAYFGEDIRGVGHRSRTPEENLAEYARAVARLSELLRGCGSVLDLGCGLGHYAVAALEAGAGSYLGIDLAPPEAPPVETPGFTFQRGDICALAIEDIGPGEWDAVLLIDVVYHVLEADRFAALLRAARVAARGRIFVTGAFDRAGERWAQHVRHRPLAAFAELGELEGVEPWRDLQMARFRVADAPR